MTLSTEDETWVQAQLGRHARFTGYLARRAGSLLGVQERLAKGEAVTEADLGESKRIGYLLHDGIKSMSRGASGIDYRVQLAALVPAVKMLDDLECELRGKCAPTPPRAPVKAALPAPPPVKAPPPPWRPWADEQWLAVERHKGMRVSTLSWLADCIHGRSGLTLADIGDRHYAALETTRKALEDDYRHLDHPDAQAAARKVMANLNQQESMLAIELKGARR